MVQPGLWDTLVSLAPKPGVGDNPTQTQWTENQQQFPGGIPENGKMVQTQRNHVYSTTRP